MPVITAQHEPANVALTDSSERLSDNTWRLNTAPTGENAENAGNREESVRNVVRNHFAHERTYNTF